MLHWSESDTGDRNEWLIKLPWRHKDNPEVRKTTVNHNGFIHEAIYIP